jgi:hypothetical protein
MARNTIILATAEVEPLPSALFIHLQPPKHITQNSVHAHTGPTKSTWTAVKEYDYHRDSQQDSNQLKILFSTKHILSTSVLTLTRRHMPLIHMKLFLWSAGCHHLPKHVKSRLLLKNIVMLDGMQSYFYLYEYTISTILCGSAERCIILVHAELFSELSVAHHIHYDGISHLAGLEYNFYIPQHNNYLH